MKEDVGSADDRPPTFCLWGEVTAYKDGELVPMGTKREQCLLVGLLAARGQQIRRESLLKWIWDDAPKRASDELDAFMTKLRKRLSDLGFADALVNKGGLCRLDIAEDHVDAHRANVLGKAQKRNDRHAEILLREGLKLTEGEPLAGLNNEFVDNYRHALEQSRLDMEVAYVQVRIRLRHYQEQLGELHRLFDEHPDDTRVAALAMCASYFSGRQSDVHKIYTRHRTHLSDKFGVDVSAELKDLQTQILNNELRPDSRCFPLGEPYSAAGESMTTETDNLLVGVHLDTGDLDQVREAIADSFREARCPTRVTADCLVCSVPAEVSPTQVVGEWMDRLSTALTRPVRVGIAVGDEAEACDLAKSDYTRRMLAAAPGGRIAVAVSEDVYQRAVLPSGRNVDPHAYRKTDVGVRGWVRIPGRAMPPHPLDEVDSRPDLPPADTPSRTGPMVMFHGTTNIEKQVNANKINKMKL